MSSPLSQQVRHSSAGPSRLQVAAGFSWDVGLNSLKPASVVQEGDSSDGEDQDGSIKVSLRIHRNTKFCHHYFCMQLKDDVY